MDSDKAWLREKLEDLDQHLGDIKVTLALNTASLQEHVRRSEMLEARVKPLEEHVVRFSGVIKAALVAIGTISTTLGIIATILKLTGHL